MTTIKTLLKWVGGKKSIMEDVLRSFPREAQTYHEICLGGGSVLINVLQSDFDYQEICAYDVNPELINFFQIIQTRPDDFINTLQPLVESYEAIETLRAPRTVRTARRAARKVSFEERTHTQENYFYWVRDQYNQTSLNEDTQVAKAVYFYFLNRTCFRGMYRTGPSGYNVPFGNYKKPILLDETAIRAVSKLIQNVIFRTLGFEDSLPLVLDHDFAYVDPPYVPITKTSFTKYVGDFNHKQLFESLRSLTGKFVMSNAAVPMITEYFPDTAYSIASLMVRRSIHAKDPSSKSKEVIVSNAQPNAQP